MRKSEEVIEKGKSCCCKCCFKIICFLRQLRFYMVFLGVFGLLETIYYATVLKDWYESEDTAK